LITLARFPAKTASNAAVNLLSGRQPGLGRPTCCRKTATSCRSIKLYASLAAGGTVSALPVIIRFFR
jgi:hypothetical protein